MSSTVSACQDILGRWKQYGTSEHFATVTPRKKFPVAVGSAVRAKSDGSQRQAKIFRNKQNFPVNRIKGFGLSSGSHPIVLGGLFQEAEEK